MRIGIIGAGFVGRAVARLAVEAGHEVMVSNSRGPRSLASIPSGIGAQVGTIAEAAMFGEVVLVAIPFEQYRSLPAEPLAGKVVIDANNHYPERDGSILALDAFETTTSELLATHLHASHVVKAFNAILAKDLEKDGRAAGSADRRALPVAGDDEASKAQVMRVIDQLGFDPLDVGSLAESWRFERAKPAYCIPLQTRQLVQALAAAEREVELPFGSWRA